MAAGIALHADAIAAEVADALNAVGIASLLLRGRVIAHHLYDDPEVRTYADADLLVQERHRERAEATIRGLAYEHRAVLGQRHNDRPPWSSTWVRERDGAEVDLHWTLVGVRAHPDKLWAALVAQAQPIAPGCPEGLNAPATALVVALHAAHHGVAVPRPIEDLQRAIERFPLRVWLRTTELAESIDASEALSAGLRLVDDGAELGDVLGLQRVRSVETILRARSAPPMALGFDWLARTPGARQKAALVMGKIAPDREFMRAWFPPARRTRGALVLAYLWRPIWLTWHSPSGVRAWLRARGNANERPHERD